MPDTDPLTHALRDLPVHDVTPARSRAILAQAQTVLARHTASKPSWIETVWERFVAPTLVTATVASYLVWAVTAAGALYR
jgi:hypothetical protein